MQGKETVSKKCIVDAHVFILSITYFQYQKRVCINCEWCLELVPHRYGPACVLTKAGPAHLKCCYTFLSRTFQERNINHGRSTARTLVGVCLTSMLQRSTHPAVAHCPSAQFNPGNVDETREEQEGMMPPVAQSSSVQGICTHISTWIEFREGILGCWLGGGWCGGRNGHEGRSSRATLTLNRPFNGRWSGFKIESDVLRVGLHIANAPREPLGRPKFFRFARRTFLCQPFCAAPTKFLGESTFCFVDLGFVLFSLFKGGCQTLKCLRSLNCHEMWSGVRAHDRGVLLCKSNDGISQRFQFARFSSGVEWKKATISELFIECNTYCAAHMNQSYTGGESPT